MIQKFRQIVKFCEEDSFEIDCHGEYYLVGHLTLREGLQNIEGEIDCVSDRLLVNLCHSMANILKIVR